MDPRKGDPCPDPAEPHLNLALAREVVLAVTDETTGFVCAAAHDLATACLHWAVIHHAVLCENDVLVETSHGLHATSSTVSRVPVGTVTARFYVDLITALVSTLTTSQQRVGLYSESWTPASACWR